jgi:hypothetical protein
LKNLESLILSLESEIKILNSQKFQKPENLSTLKKSNFIIEKSIKKLSKMNKDISLILNKNSSYKAAGILPYCYINNELHLLLGRENRDHSKDLTWSEFGGKIEEGEDDPIITACREFSEGIFNCN